MASPESEIPPIATVETSNESQGGVGVPFMVTKRMEADLRSRGYEQEEIDKMKPEEAHAILSEKVDEQVTDPIEDELDSVGVRSLTHKKAIKLALAECELALMQAHSLAAKDDKGVVLPGSQMLLEQEYSRIITAADAKILGLINRARPKSKLVVLPPVIAERIGRFSETDAEQAQFDEALRALAERDRRGVRVGAAQSVANEPKLSENKDMPKEGVPTDSSESERKEGDTSRSEKRTPEGRVSRPEDLPEEIREKIEKVFEEAESRGSRALEAAKRTKGSQDEKRAILEGAFNATGESVYKIIADWQASKGAKPVERIPAQYSRRLPNYEYVRGGRAIPDEEDGAAASEPASGGEIPGVAREPADLGADGDVVSERLKKAREVMAGRSTRARKVAPDAPVTAETAYDNPDFVKFVAERSSREGASTGDEAIQIEAFKKHRETVKQATDFYVGLLEQDGIVKVDSKKREGIRSAIDAYMLSAADSEPDLAAKFSEAVSHYNEAPARLAEKEKTLKDSSPREELEAKRDKLAKEKEQYDALRSAYGKGIFSSFFRGFGRGLVRGKESAPKTEGGVAVSVEPDKERNIFGRLAGRVAQGWRTGREAMLAAEKADKELGKAEFKKLAEVLDAGVLRNLEENIKTVETAELQKKITTEVLDDARNIIFTTVGELSGVTERMRAMTREALKKMISGGKDAVPLQASFDRLAQARDRMGDNVSPYIDAEQMNQTLEDVETIIKGEFVMQVEKVLKKDLAKEKPYNTLRKMIGQFTRLEKLGSGHSEEVLDLIKGTIEKYLEDGKDISAEKQVLLNRLLKSLEGESSETAGAATKKAEHSAETAVEGDVEKLDVPKKGALIKVLNFPFKVGGEVVSFADEHAKVIGFKGDKKHPKDDDRIIAAVSFEVEVEGKKPKKQKATVEFSYKQYCKWNGSKAAEGGHHA